MQKAINRRLEYNQGDVGLTGAFQGLPQMREIRLAVSFSLQVINDPCWATPLQKHSELVACPSEFDSSMLGQVPILVFNVF